MAALLAQLTYFVAHQIPLFLLVLGVVSLVLAIALRTTILPIIMMPTAILAIALSIAWFYAAGTTPWGAVFISSDVLMVIGVGIVFAVLAKFFSYF